MQHNGQLGEFGPLSGGTDGGVTEFLEAERLGRGAYEPPRPGTLVPTDETVSTVTESRCPDDAHLGRCVSRRHDRRLDTLYKPAAGADSVDRWQDGSSFPSQRHPKRTSVRGNKLETAVCIAASLAFNFMNWATTASGEQLTGHRIN